MDITMLELIKAIKKAERENEKADIWRNIFWNMPIESEYQNDYKRKRNSRRIRKINNL